MVAVAYGCRAAGQPVFRMSAQRMLHFPVDDSSTFERPMLDSLDQGARW